MKSGGSERAFLGLGWSFPPGLRPDGGIATAAAEEDVRQAIWIILDTAPGERVMCFDFGSGLHALTFEPLGTTTLALIKHRVEEALTRYEPRIDQLRVQVRAVPREARADIEIRYRVRDSNTFYNLVYPFYLQEGRTGGAAGGGSGRAPGSDAAARAPGAAAAGSTR